MTDTLDALEGLLGELPGAVERRKLGDRLTHSVEALKNADYHIGRLKAVLDLAQLTDFGTNGPQAELLEDLQDEAYAVGEALETATTDAELRDAIFEYEKAFQRSLASADSAVRSHWSSFAADKFRALAPLGGLLARIGVAPDLGERLQECATSALQPSNVGPLTELAERARRLVAELDDLQVERARTIGGGDRGAFINALAEQRATLSMITREVRAWLEEHQALDRFRVEPR